MDCTFAHALQWCCTRILTFTSCQHCTPSRPYITPACCSSTCWVLCDSRRPCKRSGHSMKPELSFVWQCVHNKPTFENFPKNNAVPNAQRHACYIYVCLWWFPPCVVNTYRALTKLYPTTGRHEKTLHIRTVSLTVTRHTVYTHQIYIYIYIYILICALILLFPMDSSHVVMQQCQREKGQLCHISPGVPSEINLKKLHRPLHR